MTSQTPADLPTAGDVTAALTTIWARCLQQERVGMDEDFFQLGGHSLIAMELLGEIERAFGVGVSMAELYEFPTVRQVARIIVAADRR